MCYRIQINTSIKEIAKRFKATANENAEVALGQEINGFAYPATPIITTEKQDIITTDCHWGLIPTWSKDAEIRKNTLNAKIETLSEKPSFRNITQNRCLVVVTAYYDWHWNDEKGKSKQKFIIHSSENEIFALAGIYTSWLNPATGQPLSTYAVVTTAANETMAYIHNSKKRMPVLLKQADEAAWLDPKIPYADFAFPQYDASMVAFPI